MASFKSFTISSQMLFPAVWTGSPSEDMKDNQPCGGTLPESFLKACYGYRETSRAINQGIRSNWYNQNIAS